MVQSRVGRGGRAAEGAGLENQYGIYSHRGFESHPLRQIFVRDCQGEVLEWPNRRDWKSRVPATGPWVRIPPSPPVQSKSLVFK